MIVWVTLATCLKWKLLKLDTIDTCTIDICYCHSINYSIKLWNNFRGIEINKIFDRSPIYICFHFHEWIQWVLISEFQFGRTANNIVVVVEISTGSQLNHNRCYIRICVYLIINWKVFVMHRIPQMIYYETYFSQLFQQREGFECP